MALGIQTTGGGEFRQRINYNAKSGRMTRTDRSQDSSGSWVNNEVDITDRAKFVADMPNLRVGWVYFSATGPQKVMAKIGDPIPPRPDTVVDGKPAFKQGVELTVVLHKDAADGQDAVREITINSMIALSAIDALHDAYLAANESRAGKLPVVAFTGAKAVKTKHGTNYEPQFQIVSWVDRPPALTGDAAPAASASAPAPLSPPPAAVAPPPAAVPQPAMADAFDADSFG